VPNHVTSYEGYVEKSFHEIHSERNVELDIDC
jgi:hypothetical protein